jgi:hypothetical protein
MTDTTLKELFNEMREVVDRIGYSVNFLIDLFERVESAEELEEAKHMLMGRLTLTVVTFARLAAEFGEATGAQPFGLDIATARLFLDDLVKLAKKE